MNFIFKTQTVSLDKLIKKYGNYPYLFVILLMTFIVAVFMSTEVIASDKKLTTADAEKLWTKTCFTCHGDSEDMARNFLKVVDGELQGPLHKETFRVFLTNHYLSKPKAEAMYTLLLAQANSKSRFEQECSSCHQKASDLVRENLSFNRGVLYSKDSDVPTYTFLESHQDMNKDDVKFFMRKLTLLGYEIYDPIKME